MLSDATFERERIPRSRAYTRPSIMRKRVSCIDGVSCAHVKNTPERGTARQSSESFAFPTQAVRDAARQAA